MNKIIFEDNHLLVVEKPRNILVQGDETKDVDLLSQLKIYIKENSYAERGQDVYKVLRDDINSSIVGWTFQYLPEKTIKKYYTYLGKSKANLNDLFKVKDEL